MGLFNLFSSKKVDHHPHNHQQQKPDRFLKGAPDYDTWFPRAVSTFLKVKDTTDDPYRDNVWAYACIKAIATNIAGVPFLLRNRSDDSIITDPNNPWIKLFHAPHPLLDHSQLWRSTTIYYENTGSCFWLLLNDNEEFIRSETEVPSLIVPADSRTVRPRYDDKKTMLLGWEYLRDPKTNKWQPIEFFQVIRFFEFNPESLVKGFTGLVPARMGIDIDFKAHRFNQKFFQNGADIGGILTYNGEELEEEEVENIRASWDSRFAGTENRGRTPVLTNGFDYKQIGINHKDMDFRELLKMSREEVIASINVPKHQVSLYEDTNYSTARVADRAFWNNNLIPKMKYFASVINRTMLEFTPYYGSFDLSDVEALKEGLDEKLDTALKLRKLGYSVNEINEKLDLGMDVIPDEWADENTDTNDDIAPIGAEDIRSASSIGSQVEELTKTLLSETNFDPNEFSLQEIIELASKNNQKVIDSYIEDYDNDVNRPVRKPFSKRMNGYLLKLRKEQLKLFDTTVKVKAINIDKIVFDETKWNKTLKEMAEPFQKQAIDRSIDRLETELGGFTKFERGSKEVAEALKTTNTNITGINRRLQKSVRNSLSKGVALGETEAQLRDRISNVFKNSLGRVPTIVRTETGIASSMIRAKAMDIEGLKKKWLTAGDELVRDQHSHYGTLQPKNQNYQYDLGLKYPRDINASAEQIINCRCEIIPIRG